MLDVGQQVWIVAARRSPPPCGIRATYDGFRRGDFVMVTDESGKKHSVWESNVFPTRAALIAAHPGLEVQPE
jgi:hypothetical protein